MNRRWLKLVGPGLVAGAGVAVWAVGGLGGAVGPAVHAQPGATAAAPTATAVPVGGRLQADNACYVRLPDLPRALYGGFGAYNDETGVLTFAGGAEKRSEENTISYHDLYALKLDGSAGGWTRVPYEGNAVGYLRDIDRGCREMSSVRVSASRWLSVLGKDGCDGTTRRRGDIKELTVGASASPAGVRWRAGSAIEGAVPTELDAGRRELARAFAAYDTRRGRLVFGQGAFNDERAETTRDEVYAAVNYGGAQWKVNLLLPGGPIPSRRYGSCAAYVNDPDTGVDGVIVVGGQEGQPPGTGAQTYKEVWWLDFSRSASGEWSNITARFANMADYGARREGACAYNPATKTLYTWFGRGSSGIPDGASRTVGLWRVSLAQLADAAAPLTWERLAKDNMKGVGAGGRRSIPNVYDWRNNRLFVLGGRGGSDEIDEFDEVWALYPDVTGEACANLDPYAPFGSGVPSPTPAPAPTATPVPGLTAQACPNLDRVVPVAVINAALANPPAVLGWGQLCTPGLPESPTNTWRSRLTLQNRSAAYHPIFNGVVFKCGCP